MNPGSNTWPWQTHRVIFEARDRLLAQAAFNAATSAGIDVAVPITDRIQNREERESVRDWIYYDAVASALNDGDFDLAKKYALKQSAPDVRAMLLCTVARKQVQLGQKAAAIGTLEEAARMATAEQTNPSKLRALSAVSFALASLDPIRAFETASEAVMTSNQIADLKPLSDMVIRHVGKSTGTGLTVTTASSEGLDLSRTLSTLAKTDAERAIDLARTIEKPSLKLSSMIQVAIAILRNKS